MKISKNNSVQASKQTEVYKSAQQKIKCAIDVLGKYAVESGDAKSKEIIANLSVMFFDLENSD